jgi:hypothetical protein
MVNRKCLAWVQITVAVLLDSFVTARAEKDSEERVCKLC